MKNKTKELCAVVAIGIGVTIFSYTLLTMMTGPLYANLDAAAVEATSLKLEEVIIPEVPTPVFVPEIEAPVVVPEVAVTPIITDAEFDLICRLVAAEARGESYEGQLAVAQVVRDRMEHPSTKLYGGPTVEGVVYKKSQFAKPWTGDLNNYPKIVQAVEAVFYNGERIFTEPALYFFHITLANKTVVKELRNYNYIDTIGVHEFRSGERGGQ